jgi:hypothetical protein
MNSTEKDSAVEHCGIFFCLKLRQELPSLEFPSAKSPPAAAVKLCRLRRIFRLLRPEVPANGILLPQRALNAAADRERHR